MLEECMFASIYNPTFTSLTHSCFFLYLFQGRWSSDSVIEQFLWTGWDPISWSSTYQLYMPLQTSGWVLTPETVASLFLHFRCWFVWYTCSFSTHPFVFNSLSFLCSQVFHYYAPVLDLLQLVNQSVLPNFLLSGTLFELYPYYKSLYLLYNAFIYK